MKVTDVQARVAKSLVDGPRSVAEISQELGLNEKEVEEALNGLLGLGLVRKSKEKYRLAEAVRRALETGQEINPEEYRFRAFVIVEGISEDKSALEKAQSQVLARFRNDPRFEILDLNVEEVLESDGVYTSMFEAEVLARNFSDLVYLVLTYGPSSIELVEPPSFELRASEAQTILVDTAEVVNAYAQMIADFQRRLKKAGLSGPRIRLELNKNPEEGQG